MRAEYRRKMQQRQTVLFGSIAAVLAVLLILSMLVWTGILPFPFNKEFKTNEKSTSLLTPCIDSNTAALAPNTVTVKVYNATKGAGLASSASSQLTAQGFSVPSIENWGGSTQGNTTRIITGPQGIAAAYTLQQYVPGSTVQYDSSMKDESVSLILGSDHLKKVENQETTILDTATVNQNNPEGTLRSPKNCEKVAAIS